MEKWGVSTITAWQNYLESIMGETPEMVTTVALRSESDLLDQLALAIIKRLVKAEADNETLRQENAELQERLRLKELSNKLGAVRLAEALGVQLK